jgi:hypothetical protein
MKNKPDPALLGGSYLFKEIKKRTPKSRETIPLKEPMLNYGRPMPMYQAEGYLPYIKIRLCLFPCPDLVMTGPFRSASCFLSYTLLKKLRRFLKLSVYVS